MVLQKKCRKNHGITQSRAYAYERLLLFLLLQSTLQPLWVLAGLTIVEYSQQEGFYRVPLPAARQTPQPGGPVIRTFQIPPLGAPTPETTPRILPKVATSTSLLGSFTCRKFTTWDRRLYFPSEGRRAEDFFARKIRRLWAGLNPRTRLPEASTLTSRPPKLPYERLKLHIYKTLLV